MARYAPTIRTSSPETVTGQPGQWVDYDGTRGRLMGHLHGTAWIAWGRTATRRFPKFAEAYREARA